MTSLAAACARTSVRLLQEALDPSDGAALPGDRPALSPEQEATLWHDASRQVGDAGLALGLGRQLDPLRLGPLLPVLACAPTLRDALSDLCALSELVFWRPLRLVALGTGASVRLATPERFHGRELHALEFAFAGVCALVHRMFGRVAAQGASFAYPGPAHAFQYRDALGCPVRFEAEECALDFAADTLLSPGPSPEPELRALLRAQLEDSRARAARVGCTAERVRAVLGGLDDLTRASVQLVAARLALGERTLHRQLRAAGTSYQAIFDAVRMQRCVQQLGHDTRPTKEIAYGLGFSEPSNLYRAFKRWTGLTVAEYRKVHLSF